MAIDLKKYAVLIVDDEPENLDTFELNFGRKFTVRTAQSGKAALAICRSERIAVAISDQRMPGMSGTELLAQLRKETPETVRMIVTGYTDLEAVVEAINQGAISRYIRKPWDARNLEMIIRNGVQQYQRGIERLRRVKELSAYNHILGMIAGDINVKGITRAILKTATFEFGYDRVFLLLGDPTADEALKGQCLVREGEAQPQLRSVRAAPDAVPVVPGGKSQESFSLTVETDEGEQTFDCAPFYSHPLRAGGRTVGVFAAGYAKTEERSKTRIDRDDARLIATMANQMAVAISGTIKAEGVMPPERPTDRRSKRRRRQIEAPALDLRRYPILVVDDEPENLEAFQMNFGKAFTVYTAESGEQGLKIYRKKPISVIITDQRMPGMTGVELLAEALHENPDCVRVILTGYTDLQDVIDAVNRGLVYRYIKKPWNVAEMDSMLRTAIEYYHELVESRRLLREAEVVNRLMNLMLSQAENPVDRLTETVLKVLVEDLGHDRGYLLQYDEDSGHLVNGLAMSREDEPRPDIERIRVPVIKGGGLLSEAALSERPITSFEMRPTQPGGLEFVAEGAREVCAVAVVSGDRLRAVLAAEHNQFNPREITPSDERTLTTLANQLAIAMQAAQRTGAA